jgi:hypothetical protein
MCKYDDSGLPVSLPRRWASSFWSSSVRLTWERKKTTPRRDTVHDQSLSGLQIAVSHLLVMARSRMRSSLLLAVSHSAKLASGNSVPMIGVDFKDRYPLR